MELNHRNYEHSQIYGKLDDGWPILIDSRGNISIRFDENSCVETDVDELMELAKATKHFKSWWKIFRS